MKVSVQYLSLVLLLFVACQPVSKTVHITGVIENTTAEKVKLTSDNMDLELDLVGGKFTTQFDLNEAAYFNLRLGRESTTLFLFPGQSIEVSINTEDFDESIKYAGEGAEASNYLAAKYLRQESQGIKRDALYTMEEDAFLEHLSKTETEELAFLESHKMGLGQDFLAIEKVDIEFSQKTYLLNYESAHSYYAKKEGFKPSDDLSNMITSIDFNQPQNIGSSAFGNFIISYISNKGYQLFLSEEQYSKLGNDGILKANLDLLSSTISDKKVLGFATDKILDQTLAYSSALGVEPFMKEIKSMTQNHMTFDKINKSLETWAHLAKGMPAPDFEGMTLDGHPIKLSDMKGKHVYIDVWATWCGPCLREQPALFELEGKYKNSKNLAFMGVSIDSDKAKWSKMVSEKDMKGEQIYTEGAWKSAICTEYLIKGIPRFILVDREGNIINSDAPRPSSDIIKVILKDLSGEPLLSSL